MSHGLALWRVVPRPSPITQPPQVVLEAQGGDGALVDVAVDDFKVTLGDDCINLELKLKEEEGQLASSTPAGGEDDLSSTKATDEDEETELPVTEGSDGKKKVPLPSLNCHHRFLLNAFPFIPSLLRSPNMRSCLGLRANP